MVGNSDQSDSFIVNLVPTLYGIHNCEAAALGSVFSIETKPSCITYKYFIASSLGQV